MINLKLPAELWDIIASKLAEIDILLVEKIKLISPFLKELISLNKTLNCTLFLIKNRQWNAQENNFKTRDILEWICESSRYRSDDSEASSIWIETSEWLLKLEGNYTLKDFSFDYQGLLRRACENGGLEIIKMLTDKFYLTNFFSKTTTHII